MLRPFELVNRSERRSSGACRARSQDVRARDLKDELDFLLAAHGEGTTDIPDEVLALARARRPAHIARRRSSRSINYVELLESRFAAAAVYRLLSGRAHARPWARTALQATWIDAFNGEAESLERETVGTVANGASWLSWGARDYARYVCPALVPHVDEVMKRWGARPHPRSD